MAFSLAAAGAGAAEGLDKVLARLLAERKLGQEDTSLAETSRHNLAGEALSGRNLDQNESLRQSLESERAQTIADRQRLAEEELRRQGMEGDLLKTPALDPTIRKFLELRRVVPKGETIPGDLFNGGNVSTQEGAYKITDPGLAGTLGMKVGDVIDANRNPKTNAILYRGQDVTNQVGHYEKPQTPGFALIPTDRGITRVSRTGPEGVVTQGGTPVMPQSPAQIRTRVATSQKVEKLVPELEQEAAAVNNLGLMGPVGGRWADFAAGRWGSAADFQAILGRPLSDQEEQLLAEFRSDLGFLKSGTAMVHGGARGGGSAMIMERMDKLINSDRMDYNLFTGSLNSFKKLLNKYSSFGDDGPVDEKAKEPGGLPGIGDTFQGGKVLSVTPVQ